MESLSSPKRIFILLIASGFILYLIYGVNTQTGLFLAIKPSTRQHFKNANNTQIRGDSIVKESKEKDLWKFPKFTKQKNVENSFTPGNGVANQIGITKTNRKQSTGQVGVDEEQQSKTQLQEKNIHLDIPGLLKEDTVDRRSTDKKSTEFPSDMENKVLRKENSSSAKQQLEKRLPNAIIIGVKKGGTRALLEILRIHPDVRAAGPEIHFFDRDKNYKKGLEWYRNQMPLSRLEQITIEKTPSYFVTASVPARVYQMSRSVKLIVIVRDPTRRAISDYTQGLSKHPRNPPFEKMLFKYPNSKQINEKWPKVRIGRYAEHYERWLEYFSPEQFHFVSGEGLVKDPALEVKALERFLKIRSYIQESNFIFNESKGFPCFIGKITSKGIRSEPHCLGAEKGRKHPPVSTSVLKLLQEYYRPFNKRFYDMVKRNFHWP